MTLLARVLGGLEALYGAALEKALKLAEELLAPAGPIPRSAVRVLLARARRNGAWPRLPRETRALLQAAARASVRVYRSPTLLQALRRAWVEVELATARGKAVVAALAYRLARGLTSLKEVARRGLDSLIAIGLQVLNNPLLKLQYSTPSHWVEG